MAHRDPKVSFIYDPGTATPLEDGLIRIGDKFACVLDGVSAPYSPSNPPKMFNDGQSGGKMLVNWCERYMGNGYEIQNFLENFTLRGDIISFNSRLCQMLTSIGLDLDNAATLPGATFAMMRRQNSVLELAQVGDAIVIAILNNGEVIYSPNQVRKHDGYLDPMLENFMRNIGIKKYSRDLEKLSDDEVRSLRGPAWDKFYPVYIANKFNDVNRIASPHSFGLLNGQRTLSDFIWSRNLNVDDVLCVLLLTDGFFRGGMIQGLSDVEIAENIYKIYKIGGWTSVLQEAREAERKISKRNYIDHAEATGYAIEFV